MYVCWGVDGVMVASSAHKDSIHQASGAGWVGCVQGFDRGAARVKWGLWVCERVNEDLEGWGMGGEECANLSSFTSHHPRLPSLIRDDA